MRVDNAPAQKVMDSRVVHGGEAYSTGEIKNRTKRGNVRQNSFRYFIFFIFLMQAFSTSAQTSVSVEDSMKRLATDPNFIDITNFKGVTIDLKYSTTDNFTGTNLYGNFKIAYLHKIAAGKLKKAIDLLQASHPGYQFMGTSKNSV